MKDTTIAIIVAIACATFLILLAVCTSAATQHGVNNRALIQTCIESGKRPVIGDYGRLESCE